VVVTGGLVTILHYGLLRRSNRRLARPGRLVTRGGLFARVRHPMYLGDGVVYAGLALLAPGPVTLVVFVAGIAGILGQARVEDGWLSRRFGRQHARWRERTGLLLPGA
jgi:protein-S-isoprenylcysteine O-methyltransferase Ste14